MAQPLCRDDRGETVRRAALLAGWVLALLAAIAGLQVAGTGALAGPDLAHPTSWPAWAAGRTPAQASFAVLRLLALGSAWYLLAATVLALAAAGRNRRLGSASGVLALPAVRHLVNGALGVSLVGAGAAAVATGAPRQPAVAVAEVQLAASATEAPAATGPDDGGDTPVLRRVGDDAAESEALEPAPPGPGPGEWVVAPGDHLWSVAATSLERAWGRAVDAGEVVPYWRAVVEANRERLPDPGNADLLFPGQVLTVPPPPATT